MYVISAFVQTSCDGLPTEKEAELSSFTHTHTHTHTVTGSQNSPFCLSTDLENLSPHDKLPC